jgi:post-segregation antitoxin (ccd killing protein)
MWCMKTQVYSWRLSAEVKTDLEREARVRKMPVSAILEAAVRDWLKKGGDNGAEEETQRQLHATAARCLGALSSGDPGRSERARETVRERLRRRHAR